jgi:integrase
MLTDRQLAAIKPTTTRVEYIDEKVPGLALRVTPNGAKSWTVRYRHRGRLRRLTLGSASLIPLVQARARVRDLLHDANKGADPATEKQTGRQAETIGDLAALYIEKWAKPRKRSWKADDNLLRNKVLWQSFEGLETPMAAFYKLRLLTAQRGGEVGAMRWRDVDLDAGWWTIPAGSSKNKLAHRVPLAPSVVTLLKTVKQTAATGALFVLAGARGKRQQSEAAATFTVADFRAHDLRRTAASIMASGGIPRLTISKILNHVERSITAVYDRHSYDAEKRAAIDWWDVKLQAILGNKDSANVLPFGR